MPQQSLFVNIRSRKKILHEGQAYSLTSLNDKGEFDILPKHANFISLIKNYVILDKNTPTEKTITIATGILRVKENIVDVFIDL